MTEKEIAEYIKNEIAKHKIIHPEKLDEIFSDIMPGLTYAAAFTLWKDKDIVELDLQQRTYSTLTKAGIKTIGDLIQRAERGIDYLYAIRNFGEKMHNEVVAALEKRNLIQYIGYI